MVPEEVKARLHRREHLVDLGLAGVRAATSGKGAEGLGSFVRHEDIDVTEHLARLDFLADEVSSLVGELGGLRAAFPRMRKIGGARLVPCRRERPAEPGNTHSHAAVGRVFRPGDFDGGAVGDVMKIRRQITGCDGVEVVVVAVNPVDRRGEGLVAAYVVGDVADAEPDRDFRMSPDDVARRVERAMDVAEGPDFQTIACSSAKGRASRLCPR
jgi:hypothetical protein